MKKLIFFLLLVPFSLKAQVFVNSKGQLQSASSTGRAVDTSQISGLGDYPKLDAITNIFTGNLTVNGLLYGHSLRGNSLGLQNSTIYPNASGTINIDGTNSWVDVQAISPVTVTNITNAVIVSFYWVRNTGTANITFPANGNYALPGGTDFVLSPGNTANFRVDPSGTKTLIYSSAGGTTYTFDTTPTSGSANPVTSNGIYNALGGKVNYADTAAAFANLVHKYGSELIIGPKVINDATLNRLSYGGYLSPILSGNYNLDLSTIRLTLFYFRGDSTFKITNIINGVPGQVINIYNTGTNNITIKSTTNIILPNSTDYVLQPGYYANFIIDIIDATKVRMVGASIGLTNSVPISRTLTINGATYDLSANRSWTIPTFSLTTSGTSGPATYSGGVLNIPNYAGQTYSNGYGLNLNSNIFSADTTAGGLRTASNSFNKAQTNTQITNAIAEIPTYTASNGVIKTGSNFTSDTTYNRTAANSLSLAQLQTKLNGYVPTARLLTAGLGIQTIGDLSANRTIAADTTVLKSKASALADYSNLKNAITTNSTQIGNNYTAIGLKQTKIIPADPGAANTAITSGDSTNMALYKLQKQIVSLPINSGGETLQSVTNRGNTTTTSIGAANFLGNYYDLPNQSTQPATPAVGTMRLFTYNNRLSWLGSPSGFQYLRQIYTNYAGNTAYKLPYTSGGTLLDSLYFASLRNAANGYAGIGSTALTAGQIPVYGTGGLIGYNNFKFDGTYLRMGAIANIATITLNSNSTTGGSLPASATYYYTVVPVDGLGNEGTAVTSLSVTTGSSTSTNSISFAWSAANGAFFYRVYKGTSSGTYTLRADVAGTTITDVGTNILTSGTPTPGSPYITSLGGTSYTVGPSITLSNNQAAGLIINSYTNSSNNLATFGTTSQITPGGAFYFNGAGGYNNGMGYFGAVVNNTGSNGGIYALSANSYALYGITRLGTGGFFTQNLNGQGAGQSTSSAVVSISRVNNSTSSQTGDLVNIADDAVGTKGGNIINALVNSFTVFKVDRSGLLSTQAVSTATKTVTANYTATSADHTILVNAAPGAVTVTLPPVASINGITYTIIKTDSTTNPVTIHGNVSDLINGVNNQVIYSKNDSRVVQDISASAWQMYGGSGILMNNYAASGNGSLTTITIAHGLTGVSSSSSVAVGALNQASAGINYYGIDATNVYIYYTVAPPSGTSNLKYSIQIRP